MPHRLLDPVIIAVRRRDLDFGAGGLGVQPPTPAWGQTTREGALYLTTVPWYSLGPGLALLLAVFAFNLGGDGLRDALDPRSRS